MAGGESWSEGKPGVNHGQYIYIGSRDCGEEFGFYFEAQRSGMI